MSTENRNEALAATGGIVTGSVLGSLVGKKGAIRSFEKKLKKKKGKLDAAELGRYKEEVENILLDKKNPDQVIKKLEKLKKLEKSRASKLEFLKKLAGKKGRTTGALIGGGAGLLAGLSGYEYLKNKYDGYNEID